MPIHIQPKLRAREEALEDAGLIQTLDSDGVTRKKNLESAGLVVKEFPVEHDYYFNNKKYRAK